MKFFSKDKAVIILLLIIAIVFVTFYSTSTSPLYGNGDYDSCGYILMGMELAKGNTPYLNISDNKGPVLWFIEGIGQFLINGKTGVYLTQCIFMFLSLLIITKSLKELFNFSINKQLICCFVYLIVVASLYEGGNLTEEFSLFFIIFAFYAVTLFINKKISYFKIGLILALNITCVIFIRINDSLSILYMWALILSTVFIYSKTKITDLKNYFLGSLSGFLIICIPILIYYGLNHALSNIIEDYFMIGMGYAKNNLSFTTGIVKRIILLFSTNFGYIAISSIFFMLLAVCIFIYTIEPKDKLVLILILGIDLCIVLASIVKPTAYYHYLMPVSLSFLLATAVFLNSYQILVDKCSEYKVVIFILFLLSISFISYNFTQYSFSNTLQILRSDLKFQYGKKIDNSFKELASIIPDEEKNKGLAFHSPKWYLVTDTRPIIKYIWTDTLEYNEKELDNFVKSIENNPPAWLFITNTKELSSLGEDVHTFFENNYELKKENKSGKIYLYIN